MESSSEAPEQAYIITSERENMGVLPSKAEVSKFIDLHPIVSAFGALSMAYSFNRLYQAFTSPKGSSPYAVSWDGLGMSKAEIAAKHPDGTKKGHINEMHKLMKEGYSFTEAHNEANRRGFTPGALGASTSTTTSTSASHGMMPRMTAPTFMEEHGGQPKMFGKMKQTPPSLRRRLAQGVGLGSAPTNFSGKQTLGAKREAAPSKDVHDYYMTSGLIPEMADDMVVA